MDHDNVRDELERELINIGDIPEELVTTEKAIFRPHTDRWRRPDVKLASNPGVFEGIAFEIKMETTLDARISFLRQADTYRLGGWHPVLVAQEDTHDDDSEGKITHRDTASLLDASYVELKIDDSPEFNLVHDRTPESVGLPYPIGESDFNEWVEGASDSKTITSETITPENRCDWILTGSITEYQRYSRPEEIDEK